MPGLTPAQVKARLESTARVAGQCPAFDCRADILDAAALLPAAPAATVLAASVDPIERKRSDPAMAFLGDVVGARLTYPSGGQAQGYRYGWIYFLPATGAHAVQGSILTAYQQGGGPAGVLGFPTTDETTTPDRVGRFNHFAQGGSIYWTPATGARPVYGAIRTRWAALGWETGHLGYPTSGEYGITGGRRSDFQHGSVIWIARTGSVTVSYR